MAIAFVSAADLGDNSNTTNNLTASYTCGSGLARLLVVAIIGDELSVTAQDDITGVTYAGTTMQLGAKLADNTGTKPPRYTYLYHLINPTSGANNVVINCTNTHYIAALAGDYTGVSAIGQPDATKTNDDPTGTGVALTTTITTVANNSWAVLIALGYSDGTPPTASTGDIRRTFDAAFGEIGLFDSNGAITPAGNYSMSTNWPVSAGNGIGHVIVSFLPVGPVSVDRWLLPLSGPTSPKTEVVAY